MKINRHKLGKEHEVLPGTNLLQTLVKPNNMTLMQSYEEKRDLLTGMAYHRDTTLVANRQYSYDTLGRPTDRNTSRQGTVKNDTFGYNNRSELTTATVNGSNYAYEYDSFGNMVKQTLALVDSPTKDNSPRGRDGLQRGILGRGSIQHHHQHPLQCGRSVQLQSSGASRSSDRRQQYANMRLQHAVKQKVAHIPNI